jgi:hypothetical protein
METEIRNTGSPMSVREGKETQFLNSEQVMMIDEALRSLGDFGEVRLVVEKGRPRFLVTQKSYDALKIKPGSFQEDLFYG